MACSSSTLVVSQVMVIISSCVFVVMALLTAVVSVTNITFSVNNDNNDIDDLHCHLPHRFIIPETYVTPFYKDENNFNSAISSFLNLIQASVKKKCSEWNFYPNFNFTSSINHSEFLKNFQIIYNEDIPYNSKYYSDSLSSIPLLVLTSLLNKHVSLFYSYGKYNESVRQSQEKPSFYFEQTGSDFTIEGIKLRLFSSQRPILLSIPLSFSEISQFIFLPASYGSAKIKPHSFMIYGWNDDLITERTSASQNFGYHGGFIVKSTISKNFGHSITYLSGNITRDVEQQYCPNPFNPFSWPFVPFSFNEYHKSNNSNSSFSNRFSSTLYPSSTKKSIPFFDKTTNFYTMSNQQNSQSTVQKYSANITFQDNSTMKFTLTNIIPLTCVNENKCNKNCNYYILASPNNIEEPWIVNGSVYFIEENKSIDANTTYSLWSIKEKIDNLGNIFSLQINSTSSDLCGYWIIPYTILSKTIETVGDLFESPYTLDFEMKADFTKWNVSKEFCNPQRMFNNSLFQDFII